VRSAASPRLPREQPTRPSSAESTGNQPSLSISLSIFHRNELKLLYLEYTLTNAYIYVVFLLKIKVGRPPFLALLGAPPLVQVCIASKKQSAVSDPMDFRAATQYPTKRSNILLYSDGYQLKPTHVK
jgi:hypothetical protein